MTLTHLPQEWNKIETPEPTLVDSRLQLHWAAQILASVGAAHVLPRNDDSHRSLNWIADAALFAGNLGETTGFRMALHPRTLELRLLDVNDLQVSSVGLYGRTLDDGYRWAEKAISSFSGTDIVPLVRPEYDLPQHSVSTGARFDVSARDLKTISDWYANADMVLQQLAEGMDDFSPVRCWPHHFDLAGNLTLTTGDDPETGRSVGVGMTPGDGSHSEPYWYVSPWPYPDSPNFPELPAGHWHTDGWTGAVLTASDIGSLTRREKQAELVFAFVESALEGATELALSGTA